MLYVTMTPAQFSLYARNAEKVILARIELQVPRSLGSGSEVRTLTTDH